MSLINIEYLFDRKKMIFYFISDLRIDFRNLAKELATMFKARIELRQLGPREQAKILGDLGVCGRSLCCKTFLDDYELISIKTAKDQGVSMNPIKLSGICGKLKCCLKFEENLYIDHSQEPEKTQASIERIIETAKMGKTLGLYSIVFHAAYNMGMSKEEVYQKVYQGFFANIPLR